jgi:5'-nucleotidase
VRRGDRRWQVDGTPTDCVMLAVEALMPERPDFVLSGVNHGQNMGEDVLYSGTVAAAMEGVMLGHPGGRAVVRGGDLRADPSTLAGLATSWRTCCSTSRAAGVPARHAPQREHPAAAAAEVRGVKLTRLGRRVYSNSLTPMQDPWGRDIYWIGGGSATWRGEADSDFQAVLDGYVSVTPLSLDLTNHGLLTDTASWWRAP